MKQKLVLSFTLIFLTLLSLILLLFIPVVTQWISQKALEYYLFDDVTVTRATLTNDTYTLQAHMGTSGKFEVGVDFTIFDGYTLDVSYRGDIAYMTRLSTQKLPHIDINLDAHYKSSGVYTADAKLLDGNIHASGDIATKVYELNISQIDIASFFKQQESMPEYLSGRIHANSHGAYSNIDDIAIDIETDSLYLEPSGVALISDRLKGPIPVKLVVGSNIDKDILTVAMALDTPLLDLKEGAFSLNTKTFAYELDFELVNRGVDKVDIHSIAFHSKGNYLEQILRGDATFQSDFFRFELNDFIVPINDAKKQAHFRLSSLEKSPVNFQGAQEVVGRVSMYKQNIEAQLKLASWQEYLYLNYKNKDLKFNTKQIPILSLQKVLQLPHYAYGDIAMRGAVSFKTAQPQYHVTLESFNCELNSSLQTMSDINESMDIKAKIYNDKERVLIEPELRSTRAILAKSSRVVYDPNKKVVDYDLYLKDVSYKQYQATSIESTGTLSLVKELRLHTTLKSSYETVMLDVRKGTTLKGDANLSVTHLDRFIPVDASAKIASTVHFEFDKENHIVLKDKRYGIHHLDIRDNDAITLISTDIDAQAIQELFKIKPYVLGDFSLEALYDAKEVSLHLNTPQLKSHVPEKLPLLETPLDVNVTLKREGERFKGDANIQTHNEQLAIKLKQFDTNTSYVESDFSLDVKNLSELTYKVDIPISAPLSIEHGSITLGSTQHVHIEVPHFVLPYDLYHKINSDAKKGLIIALKADASHEAGKVVLEGQLISDFITFTKIGLNTDLKQHDYQATTTLQTPLFPDDVKIAVQGNYQDKVVSSASINAPYERLTFKKIDYTTNNYEAPYFLRLKETPKDYKYFHHKAEVHGVITSQPVPRIYMNSQSFGGDMNASIDDTYAKVALHQVSLVKLLNFSDVDAPVNSGIMNADIRLQSHALFSENSDDINGAIHVNATNIEIQGINVDENINIIRNTQDISIFEGHIPGLSLLAKTLKTPMRLTGVSKEKSFIKEANIQARIVDSNLSCQDCAMKTKENRIAINGNIIINQNMAFENFYVGFLLDNGCAYYKQQIEGTITHPKVQTAVTSFNVITGTVSSAVDVVGDGISNVVSHIPGVDTLSRSAKKVSPEALNKALSKQECHPFYLGQVQ